jgi:hypothetical protein
MLIPERRSGPDTLLTRYVAIDNVRTVSNDSSV